MMLGVGPGADSHLLLRARSGPNILPSTRPSEFSDLTVTKSSEDEISLIIMTAANSIATFSSSNNQGFQLSHNAGSVYNLINVAQAPSPSTATHNYDFGVRLRDAPQIDENLFIGRDRELEQLQIWLTPSPGRQNIVALYGMGGIGKTQLGIHMIRRSGRRYSLVYWFNAKDENTLKAGLAALAIEVTEISVSSTPIDAHEEERLAQQARQWLSQQGNDRWLIVYDNYDDPRLPGIDSATGYDVRTYFPSRAQGSILITTRSPRLAFAKQLPVTKLQDIGQSLAILATRSGRKVDGGRRKTVDEKKWLR